MIKWSYCTKGHPEYEDLLALARVINYNKRRMWSIYDNPAQNGFKDDPFTIKEAINNHVKKIEELSDEYRYMVMMYMNENNLRHVR